ncbi:MAG: MerR family transcriptional regulator [Chitinophagaceae bacterium]|nr:MerR family transcriptional regulator [Chitinophagaceae bacterium]
MSIYSIKDLEQVSGIKAHTIRIWEQRYNFLQPLRTDTNIRTYNASELKVILNVSLLNKYGFKISHIDKMTPEQMEEKILSLNQLDAVKERVINGLIKEMVSLNMGSFEMQLDIYIGQKGIERTVLEIVFPFLERVGVLWMTNHVNPAQEHLATNILRQKLILGIEKLPAVLNQDKNVILFMPEGEHHEIGLLLVYFLLKQQGVFVNYLGANVPLRDLAFLNGIKKPEYIFCHITSPSKLFKLDRFITHLGQISNATPVLLSGQLIKDYKGKLSDNIKVKISLTEVLQVIRVL